MGKKQGEEYNNTSRKPVTSYPNYNPDMNARLQWEPNRTAGKPVPKNEKTTPNSKK